MAPPGTDEQGNSRSRIWNWKCVISKSNIWQGSLRRRNWIWRDKRFWSHKEEENIILEFVDHFRDSIALLRQVFEKTVIFSLVNMANIRIVNLSFIFLAVQNSSIGDLVTHSLTDSRYFYFWHTKSDPRDLWPLRHLIRVMRRNDLTFFGTFWNFFWNFFGTFLELFETFLELFGNFLNLFLNFF